MVPRHQIRRVLVVEDVEPVRNAVRRSVRLLLPEALIHTAVDGVDAVDQLRAAQAAGEPIDLCIADHHLPHLTGVEVVERTRAQALPTSFILTSGRIDDGMRAEAKRLGVALLDKPFGVDAFELELDRLQQRSAPRQLFF